MTRRPLCEDRRHTPEGSKIHERRHPASRPTALLATLILVAAGYVAAAPPAQAASGRSPYYCPVPCKYAQSALWWQVNDVGGSRYRTVDSVRTRGGRADDRCEPSDSGIEAWFLSGADVRRYDGQAVQWFVDRLPSSGRKTNCDPNDAGAQLSADPHTTAAYALQIRYKWNHDDDNNPAYSFVSFDRIHLDGLNGPFNPLGQFC